MSMADPLLAEAPPEPNLTSEFESLAIPPMDPLFFSAPDSVPATDLAFPLDENGDFQLTFDDFDDLFFPSESEPFILPDIQADFTPDSGSSDVSVDPRSSDVETYLNCSSPESGSPPRPDSSRVSSEGSGVSMAMNAPSPDSGNVVVEQKIKVEETGKVRVSKRKKDNDDASTSKYRRSSLPGEDANTNVFSEEDKKRRARLMRNRESAQLSRQRKKHYVEELEDKVRSMHSTITDLNNKIAYFMAENATLRQQLGGGGAAGMCPPPPLYPPMAPVPYPWVPCAPYVLKPQGSQVPLVPIPRLKQRQPISASKAKKTENKKSEAKTKKVASVSFLGLLFFIFLFGGLLPIVNVRYGGTRDNVSLGSNFVGDKFYDLHKGRVLQVNGPLNGSDDSKFMEFPSGSFDISNGIHRGRGHGGGSENDAEQKERGANGLPGYNESFHLRNGSEPLVASLYVPRNNKLVKIDGNLIIHSVLASERAMASHDTPEMKNKRENGVAITRDFSPALVIPDASGNAGKHPRPYKNPAERQKALSSGSADALKDHVKSTAADGRMQQWFREGLAGPMLSSGMCTEVFQFDVSPTPGAIVPASPVTNVSAEQHRNDTQLNRGRNRRILHGLPVPLSGSDVNITKQHGRNSPKENIKGNKTASSMVVSVLVDPREAGDGDTDGVIAPKSLSRIFVVVLLDSVKYVTYSCVLPRSGPHLVTT